MPRTRAIRSGLVSVTALALTATALTVPAAAQDDMTGEGKSLAIITPFYASQPATKEAIDLFLAEAAARGYDTKMVDTANDNAAVSGEMAVFWTFGLAFGFVLQRSRFCFASLRYVSWTRAVVPIV